MYYLKSYIPQLVPMTHGKLDKHLDTSRKKQELYGNFQWIEFKCLNHVQPFQGESLLLTIKPLGVPGNLLIEPAMKPPSGFEPAKTELAISHYSFIVTNWCIKDLKDKLF